MSALQNTFTKNTALFLAVLVASVVMAGLAVKVAQAADPAVTPAVLTVTSNNASTTLAKVGNTLTYTLTLSGSDSVPLVTPQIKLTGLASTTMTPGATRTYTYATTTYSSGIAEGAIGFQMSVGATTGNATTTLSQANLTAANVRFDKTAPTVTSITSSATSAGVLKVGNTIVFTLTPGATEYGATVAGSYEGHSLSWSTANLGVTFTATYTVTESDADQATALQITGVILTDAAGNASSATAGSDVVKTIDANSPSAPTASIPAGSFSGSKDLVLSSTGSNSIRYTEDGSTPSCSSGTVFSGSVTLSATETVKAMGCDTAGNGSSVASFDYVRNSTSSGGGGNNHHSSGSSSSSASVSVSAPSVTASVVTSTPSVSSFTRDLFVGVVGDDVKALQAFLNTHGFAVAVSGVGSSGMETTTFGGLTRAAVARFQAANGIAPAVGRFGPLTRAAVTAAMK
jgi:hypothetical protein